MCLTLAVWPSATRNEKLNALKCLWTAFSIYTTPWSVVPHEHTNTRVPRTPIHMNGPLTTSLDWHSEWACMVSYDGGTRSSDTRRCMCMRWHVCYLLCWCMRENRNDSSMECVVRIHRKLCEPQRTELITWLGVLRGEFQPPKFLLKTALFLGKYFFMHSIFDFHAEIWNPEFYFIEIIWFSFNFSPMKQPNVRCIFQIDSVQPLNAFIFLQLILRFYDGAKRIREKVPLTYAQSHGNQRLSLFTRNWSIYMCVRESKTENVSYYIPNTHHSYDFCWHGTRKSHPSIYRRAIFSDFFLFESQTCVRWVRKGTHTEIGYLFFWLSIFDCEKANKVYLHSICCWRNVTTVTSVNEMTKLLSTAQCRKIELLFLFRVSAASLNSITRCLCCNLILYYLCNRYVSTRGYLFLFRKFNFTCWPNRVGYRMLFPDFRLFWRNSSERNFPLAFCSIRCRILTVEFPGFQRFWSSIWWSGSPFADLVRWSNRLCALEIQKWLIQSIEIKANIS